MIDRNSPIPLYYQLKLYFKQQVESGNLTPGDRLPTEMELCEEFEISRAPVRQALTELALEGLIYRRPGQGSFIAPIAQVSLENKTKIVVLSHNDVRWMSSLETAVLLWNRQIPDRQVELDIKMCSMGEYHQTIRRMTVRGEAPDIAPMDYVWINHYATESYITPLNVLDPVWVDEILHDMELPVMKYNTIGGYLYGLPVQTDLSGIWYRRDWFLEEGIAPPITWPDLLECIDYFARPDVMNRLGYRHSIILPISSTTGEATVNLLMAFIWSANGHIVDKDGNPTIDDPAVYRALEFLREITIERRSSLPPNVNRLRWWELVNLFARGSVPMALGGTYEWHRIYDASLWKTEDVAMDRLGFALLPRPQSENTPVSSLGGTSWTIFNQSTVQDICLELFRIMASREVSMEFCKNELQISPYVSVNNQLMSLNHPWFSSIIPMLEYAQNRPRISNYFRLSRYLQELFERTLWDGDKIDETIEQTSRIVSAVLNE